MLYLHSIAAVQTSDDEHLFHLLPTNLFLLEISEDQTFPSVAEKCLFFSRISLDSGGIIRKTLPPFA